MANNNKIKGDHYEKAVLALLEASGIEGARKRVGGVNDTGDVAILAFNIECKSWEKPAYSIFMNQLMEQIRKSKKRGILFVRRRGRPINESYILMPYKQVVEYIKFVQREALRQKNVRHVEDKSS